MIEDTLQRFEEMTILTACVPLLGTIPAALKIVVGTIQVIVALVITLFTAMISPFSNQARNVCKRAAVHIVHGFANILAGSIEALPIVSFFAFCVRDELLGIALASSLLLKYACLESPNASAIRLARVHRPRYPIYI